MINIKSHGAQTKIVAHRICNFGSAEVNVQVTVWYTGNLIKFSKRLCPRKVSDTFSSRYYRIRTSHHIRTCSYRRVSPRGMPLTTNFRFRRRF